MNVSGRVAIAVWLAFVALCALVISRTQFTADLSAFLPASPTPEQELLLEQIRDGLASRLILVGLEGGDSRARAGLSKAMAQQLRGSRLFASVSNGEPVRAERDRRFLFDNRYLLSPAVAPDHFSVTGLRTALKASIDGLATPGGLLFKSLLPSDPTGEMARLVAGMNTGGHPRIVDGVWASRDGRRALLLVQTRALGSDTDAQQATVAAIETAFASAVLPGVRLLMTGPGVFSVSSRALIKEQVSRLSLISVLLIAGLLLLVYRSPTALALGFLPVVTGAVAGVTAVSLGFGSVHGITLGFGTALIGEAVDYSIYLFIQSRPGPSGLQDWRVRFWPTIRLGVLTSIFGFASLLLSGFPGLAQLGMYAITGLVVAAAVTRFVLPHLLPAGFQVHDVTRIGSAVGTLIGKLTRLRWLALVMVAAATVVVVQQRANVWDTRISALSPVSQDDVALDAELRADLGAPDVRYLAVVSGADRESVLSRAEQVSAILTEQVVQGGLAGYSTPSQYLPSEATQGARQASLPAPEVLEARLRDAVVGLPVRASIFAPFVADVARARTSRLIERADLDGTSMSMAVDAMLLENQGHWTALMPLTAPAGGEIDADRLRKALADTALPDVLVVDMKWESDRLYSGYLSEAIELSLGGLAAILALLLWVFRSPLRVLRIVAPLAAAVLSVTALLIVSGQQLMILHLIGLLLVVAVGSNYALFFERSAPADTASVDSRDGRDAARALASLLLAGFTTVTGFGVLAFADVSLLKAMGVTVAPGVILALFYSAAFSRRINA